MPTPVLRLAALLSGLLGPPGAPAELPATGEVVAESLDAHVEPDGNSVAPERLGRGAAVRVVDAGPAPGWLTIEPPGPAFDWVDGSRVRKEGRGVGRVVAPGCAVRVGVPGARLPGPPRAVLEPGATVRLLDRPGLSVGPGRSGTSWLAVAPLPGEVRYVRAAGVSFPRGHDQAPPREVRASYEADPAAGRASPGEVAAEVARVEAEHRAALSGPMEGWRLEPVRGRYEALLKRVSDPATADALRARVGQVARQQEAARSARAFATILGRSRRRDQEVAMVRRRLAQAEQPRRRPFAAKGLIQASSREVDGRRVYALIGPDGDPVAYLDVPPGLDARPSLSKLVGVRGSVRYDDALGARLIAVKDLEPLE